MLPISAQKSQPTECWESNMKMYQLLKNCLKIFILLSLFNCCLCTKSLIDKTYQKGVKAYTGERWSECIVQFEESLHLYKLYRKVIINCRLKCNSQQYESYIKEDMVELKTYEKFFFKRNCLKKCQKAGLDTLQLGETHDESILFNMKQRKAYEYLHMCYFQMYALPKAASAVYTYLVAHPADESMQHNLQYYVEQPEVDIKEVVDLQSEDYNVLFSLGIKAYNRNNWGETIASMEEVINEYLSSENSCRVECEEQPGQEISSEFIITVSNSMAALVHCQQQCQDVVKQLGYRSGTEFLADILNYLQISYYRLDRFKDAAKAVESYLVLIPNDEDMLQNKKIYSSLLDSTAFINRSDILYYNNRDISEKQLLHFFHDEDNDINT